MSINHSTILTSVDARLDFYTQWLKQRLSVERFEHSIGTYQKALDLARGYGLSNEIQAQVATAGLLHDAAKLMSPAELLDYCQTHHIEVSEEERLSPQILHPFVGAHLVETSLDIHDHDILQAIRYHTTARAGMSVVEKIVYLADKIEENTRNPLYTSKISALIDYENPKSLDVALLYLMDSTLCFLIERTQRIHPTTLNARNELLSLLKSEKTPYQYVTQKTLGGSTIDQT